MSADIVNLRRARKARVRSQREKEAADNRIAFGRSKAAKAVVEAERQRAGKAIEGHRREAGREEPGDE